MIERVKNIISKKTGKNELFWLLLLGFTVRHILYQYQHALLYNTDTVTYYYAAQDIFKGLIDASRTPVYPALIKLFEWVWPDQPFQKLVIFQHLASFFSIIPFYRVCKRWFKNRIVRIIAVVVWGCFPPVLAYNNALFAESVLITSLVWFIWLFSEFIARPTATKAVILNFYLFYLVMVKPVSLVFYGVLGAMWFFNFLLKKNLHLLKPVMISFAISIGLVFSYCILNKYQNGYWGVTTVSHDNTFINVIFSGAYKNLPDEKFVTAIDTTLDKGHYYTIFYLNNDHDKYHKTFEIFPLEYQGHWDMQGVYVIPPNRLGYTVKQVAACLKKAIASKTYLLYLLNKPVAFLNYGFLYIKGLWMYLLALAETVVILYGFIKQGQLQQVRLFNLLMIAGILVAFFIGGVYDGTYRRVLLPLAPFLILLFFSLVDTVSGFLINLNPRYKIKKLINRKMPRKK